MNVLIYGLGLFIIAFLLHAAIWHIKTPANDIKALIVLFNLVLALGILAFMLSESQLRPAGYLHIALLFYSLFACYLLSYPAIAVDSPSLVIVTLISQSGKNGFPREKIKELMRDDLLVETRLKDLVDSGLVDLEEETYKINKKGVFFVRPFVLFRKFLRLGKGG